MQFCANLIWPFLFTVVVSFLSRQFCCFVLKISVSSGKKGDGITNQACDKLAEDMTGVLAPSCPQPVPPSPEGGMESFGGKARSTVTVQFPFWLCVKLFQKCHYKSLLHWKK